MNDDDDFIVHFQQSDIHKIKVKYYGTKTWWERKKEQGELISIPPTWKKRD